MFRIDKLTQKAQEALQQCQAIAEKYESQVMFPLHLLVALADGVVASTEAMADALRERLDRLTHPPEPAIVDVTGGDRYADPKEAASV